jgi:hypothetical protein
MRPVVLAVLVGIAGLFAAGSSHAFCVYNGLKDHSVFATVLTSKTPKPARLFGERVAPGKEACCNPRNGECNPDTVVDTANIAFEVRVEGTPPTPCGAFAMPRRTASGVEAVAPARGSLRFEANPAFVATRPASPENPPYLIKVSATPEPDKVAWVYPCPPRPAPRAPG